MKSVAEAIVLVVLVLLAGCQTGRSASTHNGYGDPDIGHDEDFEMPHGHDGVGTKNQDFTGLQKLEEKYGIKPVDDSVPHALPEQDDQFTHGSEPETLKPKGNYLTRGFGKLGNTINQYVKTGVKKFVGQLPDDVQLALLDQMPGRDLVTGLVDGKKAWASVSRNCNNGAMQGQANDLRNYEGIHVERHSTFEEMLENIAKAPADTETYFLSSHGYPGGACGVTVENGNIPVLAKLLRDKGAKQVIIGACSTGQGKRGDYFLKELSRLSGAQCIAMTDLVWTNGSSIYLNNSQAKVKVAIPIFHDKPEPEPVRHDDSTRQHRDQLTGVTDTRHEDQDKRQEAPTL